MAWDAANSVARVVALAVVMRRSSWLQTAGLSQEMQTSIQDLPFDGGWSLLQADGCHAVWGEGYEGHPSFVGIHMPQPAQKPFWLSPPPGPWQPCQGSGRRRDSSFSRHHPSSSSPSLHSLDPLNTLGARKARLHTLDVRWVLAFYIDRTKLFCKSMQLFVAVADRMKVCAVLAQSLSFWTTACIHYCYELGKVPLPVVVLAHSTRVQASLAAFLAQVPIQETCQATTWSSVHTFASRYALT